MDGAGMRFSRATSRYGSISGPGPSAPAFNGPVRKWKKDWVPSQQPNDIPLTGKSNRHPHRHKQHNNNNKTPLLLCRWTPVPSTANSLDATPEPAKRKFRYTPKRRRKRPQRDMKMNQSRLLTVQDDMLTDNDFTEENEELDEDEA